MEVNTSERILPQNRDPAKNKSIVKHHAMNLIEFAQSNPHLHGQRVRFVGSDAHFHPNHVAGGQRANGFSVHFDTDCSWVFVSGLQRLMMTLGSRMDVKRWGQCRPSRPLCVSRFHVNMAEGRSMRVQFSNIYARRGADEQANAHSEPARWNARLSVNYGFRKRRENHRLWIWWMMCDAHCVA